MYWQCICGVLRRVMYVYVCLHMSVDNDGCRCMRACAGMWCACGGVHLCVCVCVCVCVICCCMYACYLMYGGVCSCVLVCVVVRWFVYM